MTKNERRNLFAEVTDRIIAALNKGVVPWHRPWRDSKKGAGTLPTSVSTGKPYRGINVFLLDMTANADGYTSQWWGTFNALKERGGIVRKGEKGTTVVFWKRLVVKTTPEEKAKTGKDKKVIPMLRHFNVFNVEQCEWEKGMPERFDPSTLVEDDDTEWDPIAEAEAIVKGYEKSPSIHHGGDAAYYSPSRDMIQVPDAAQFETTEQYYSTLFHELTHSTGHKDRLNRNTLVEGHRFGDEMYAKEELVAEMGAAMLAAVAGIHLTTIEPSAAYIKNWLQALSNDEKLVISAGAAAQKAADHILGIKFEDDKEDDAK